MILRTARLTLRRATMAVDGLFADRWKGAKAVPWSVNGLAWPRRAAFWK